MSARRAAARFALLAVLAIGAAACGGRPAQTSGGGMGVPMTSEIVDQRGAAAFRYPRAVVFAATEAVLRRAGYHIGFVDQAFTSMKTEPILAGDPTLTAYERSYSVTFSDVDGGTRVRIAPHMWLNRQDVSATPVWNMDGPTGELALWEGIFREIDAALKQLPQGQGQR